MPPTAAMRFFELPELVAHFSHHLVDHKTISCLMKTSRHLYVLCTPALFYNVFAGCNSEKQNLLASMESIEALARNVHHVRQLELHVLDMVYYVNCVFAYQNQSSTQSAQVDAVVTGEGEAQEQDMPTVSRPRWLAPPDPRICVVFPIPPMTLLTRLDLDLGYLEFSDDCPYLLSSCRDPRATLTQACWLLESNPLLTDLRLSNVLIKDQRDVRRLSRSISGLKQLQNAHFEFMRWADSGLSLNPLVAMFLCCAPSLQTLFYEVTENDDSWINKVTDEYREHEPGGLHSWETHGYEDLEVEWDEEEEEEKALKIMASRRLDEPMNYLTSLQLWGYSYYEASGDEFRGMLALCPNLTDIVFPLLYVNRNHQQIAQEIARTLCPKLTTLVTSHNANVDAMWLMVRTLETLPEQQVQKFVCLRKSFIIPDLRSGDVGSMFQRQSRTLRELRLEGCWNFDSKAVQVILVECVALEQLEVRFQAKSRLDSWQQRTEYQQQLQRPLCIELEDAVEFPWGCTRIKELNLTIVIPDKPLHRLAKGEVPYHDRPSPTILTEEEKAQFQTLEMLYQQLGALKELECMDLKASYYDPVGSRPVSSWFRLNSFPGMLNLRNETTGRPGYLHHLGGLNKLKALFGSVSATTEETKVTIGMEEVEWMHKHWPALEKAHFFTNKNEEMFTEPFNWLLKQRVAGKMPLQLATRV
ncbi:hypothetical protein BGZ96_003704 [Linnemannia gamsii]|uniref:F-box domain-containing protein n=1 Tax=Linnemannia gamsii TaxID=64522 RepID=A0ABQ7K7U9_9FUNG|nr:hypothetical protein BGZ96_003704 [Linnemannia gamsii]